MSAPQKFEIQISMPADVSGGQKSAATLSSLKVSVDNLSQSTRQQLGLLSDQEKQQQKYTEKVEESNVSHREAHRVMADLNRIIPGVGSALHAAFAENPMGKVVLGAAAFLEVLSKISEHLLEIENRGRAAFGAVTQSALDAQSEIVKMQESNEAFWRAVERHASESSAKDEFAVAMASVQSKLEAARHAAEVQKQTEIESVDASEKAGQIPKGQADARKTEIEAFYRDLLTGKQTAANQSENDARSARIAELEKQVDIINQNIHAIQEINTSAGASARDADIKQLKDFLTDLHNKFVAPVGAFGAEPDREVMPPEIMRRRAPNVYNEETFTANDVNYKNSTEFATRLINELEHDKTSREGSQKTLEDDLGKAASELEQLKTQQKIATNRAGDVASVASQIAALNNLSDSIKQLAALGVLGHTSATAIPFRPGQNNYNNAAAEDIFNRGVSALDARQHLLPGQKLAEDKQREIDALNQLIESLGWGPQVLASLERSIRLHQSFAAVVKAMDTRIHEVEEEIKSVSRPRS